MFIIFEVEVALFFPPAAIFGKATQLMDPRRFRRGGRRTVRRNSASRTGHGAMGARQQCVAGREEAAADARLLALAAMADLGLFFAVILVGFAYVWRRGDLDLGPGRGRAAARPRRTAPT